MFPSLKKLTISLCQVGLLLSCMPAQSADLLPLAKDIKPNTNNLPPAFVKPCLLFAHFSCPSQAFSCAQVFGNNISGRSKPLVSTQSRPQIFRVACTSPGTSERFSG